MDLLCVQKLNIHVARIVREVPQRSLRGHGDIFLPHDVHFVEKEGAREYLGLMDWIWAMPSSESIA
jgi:hypothetical protein